MSKSFCEHALNQTIFQAIPLCSPPLMCGTGRKQPCSSAPTLPVPLPTRQQRVQGAVELASCPPKSMSCFLLQLPWGLPLCPHLTQHLCCGWRASRVLRFGCLKLRPPRVLALEIAFCGFTSVHWFG